MKFHKKISLIKSIIRIAGFILMLVSFPLAIGILILAEVFGILEEQYEN